MIPNLEKQGSQSRLFHQVFLEWTLKALSQPHIAFQARDAALKCHVPRISLSFLVQM